MDIIDTCTIQVDGLERCFINVMMIFITGGYKKVCSIYGARQKIYRVQKNFDDEKFLMMNDVMIERSA